MVTWLLKVGAFTVGLRVVAMVVTLTFVAGMSQIMTAASFGVLSMLITTCTLVATMGSFGQSEWIVKEASPLVGEGDRVGAQALFHSASWRVLVVSTPLGLLTGMLFLIFSGDWLTGLAAGMIVVMLSYALAWAGAARSLDRYFWSLGPKDILWRAGVLGLGGLAATVGGGLVGLNTVLMLTAGVLLVCVVAQAYVLGIDPKKVIQAIPEDRVVWLAGMQMMLAATAIAAQSNLDVVLIGIFMSAEQVAVYFPANRLALAAGFFFLPFQMIVAPAFARLIRSRDDAGMRKLSTLATLLVTTASVAAVVTLVFGYPLYEPLFATATGETRKALHILLAGQLGVAALGFPGALLIMSGHQKILARTSIVFLVLGGITLTLAAALGTVVTVAIAAAGMTVLRKLVTTLIAGVHTGVWPLHLSVLRVQRDPDGI